MGMSTIPWAKGKRRVALVGTLLLALALILLAAQVINAAETAAQLSASKTASRSTIVPPINDTIEYTVVVSNTGDAVASNVVVTDTLVADLIYVADSVTATTGTPGVNNNVISWSGSLDSNTAVTITFQATVTDTASAGEIITNTAEITGTGSLLTPFATTEVVSPSVLYMPIMFKSPPKLALAVSRPNSANQWTASWNDGGIGVTSYELQESQDPNFGSFTPTSPGNVGLDMSRDFAPSISADNAYYYRVRAVAGSVLGPWSNVQTAIGGYRDDFNDPSTGWGMRRTTYLEETNAYYGSGNEAGKFIMIVADRWDWLIASPLAPAPAVPYSIEYRARVHDASNLVSGGMVFGGDWNYDACPEYGNVYKTDNCFNHFYNFNYIFYGPIKLLFERVDRLEWCLRCSGSPLKRLGPTQTVDPVIGHGGSLDWHTYRVDVRADGARLYIDNSFVRHFTDTSYINDPYFGMFASTDEYKPSIWFYDYFQVVPLD